MELQEKCERYGGGCYICILLDEWKAILLGREVADGRKDLPIILFFFSLGYGRPATAVDGHGPPIEPVDSGET